MTNPVSLLVIHPTVLTASGVAEPIPPALDGSDLLEIAQGKAQTERPIFFRYGPYSAVRHGAHKLIVHQNHPDQLYNVVEDPSESRNVVAQHAELVAELKALLAAWDETLAQPRWGFHSESTQLVKGQTPSMNIINSKSLAWAFIAVLALSSSILPASGVKLPNVIVILADDYGYGDTGAYGSKQVPTPNIDSLANSGVCFTNGYTNAPVCAPTRTALMTGKYQNKIGFEVNPSPREEMSELGLPVEEKTIAEILKPAGYATGLVGKWHLGVS